MKIGVPTEIKPQENRVALTPAGADRLVASGHSVLVQENAGVRTPNVLAVPDVDLVVSDVKDCFAVPGFTARGVTPGNTAR